VDESLSRNTAQTSKNAQDYCQRRDYLECLHYVSRTRPGGEKYALKFRTGLHRPEVQFTLALWFTNLSWNGTPSIYLKERWYLLYTSKAKIVDHRGILDRRGLQAFLHLCVTISAQFCKILLVLSFTGSLFQFKVYFGDPLHIAYQNSKFSLPFSITSKA